jgi:hypothetical protein
MQIEQVIESENTENIPDESTEQIETESTEIDSDPVETDGEAKPEESGYEPNYKFKVLDDELEFDDRIRDVVKDKDTEEYIRDLYTKAHGLDSYKSKLETKNSEMENLQSKYQETESYLDTVKQGIDQLENLSKDDFMAFQRRLEIPDEKILDRAREILQLRDRPAHEQQRYEQSVQDKMNYQRSQSEMQKIQSQNVQLQRRQHDFEMQQVLNQPEITEFQKRFDERLGDGAFKRHVDQYGTVQHQNGRYAMPTEAVMSVFKQYKPLIGTETTTTARPSQSTSNQSAPPKPMKNLGSGVNQTVTAKPYRSLDEIRKAAESMPYNG